MYICIYIYIYTYIYVYINHLSICLSTKTMIPTLGKLKIICYTKRIQNRSNNRIPLKTIVNCLEQ